MEHKTETNEMFTYFKIVDCTLNIGTARVKCSLKNRPLLNKIALETY